MPDVLDGHAKHAIKRMVGVRVAVRPGKCDDAEAQRPTPLSLSQQHCTMGVRFDVSYAGCAGRGGTGTPLTRLRPASPVGRGGTEGLSVVRRRTFPSPHGRGLG